MENNAARKRKQVPEGYLIIGVDPHKRRHAAVAITQDFVTRDRFKFDNTREGLEFLLRRVRTEMVKSDFRAWAKQRRERPVHNNPLGGREVVGAALNRLLRLAFILVKKQTFYRLPWPEQAMVAI
jgi:hypothetical protein